VQHSRGNVFANDLLVGILNFVKNMKIDKRNAMKKQRVEMDFTPF